MKMPIQIIQRLSDEERSSLQAFSSGIPLSKGVLVAWASETGTAERLAFETATALQAQGVPVGVVPFNGVSLQQLATTSVVLLITSTWGDGEPPSNGECFVEALAQAYQQLTPLLPHLRYSVCAVGDSAYPQFCQCGKTVDTALAGLGATRLVPLATCDIDVEPDFKPWLALVLQALAD